MAVVERSTGGRAPTTTGAARLLRQRQAVNDAVRISAFELVIEEMRAAGFTHVRTIDAWPPGEKPGRATVFLTLFRK